MSGNQTLVDKILAGFDMASGMLRASWGDPHAWESSLRRFEARDRLRPPRPGAVVFTGSSSITFWDSLERDMAPLPVLNRGFGGSRILEVAAAVDRVVVPYKPRAVVLFAGTNDIAWPRPAAARQVFDGYLEFVRRLRAGLPETPLYYVSITPTPSRWEYWPIVREANRLIQDYAKTDPCLHFIDLVPAILGPDGTPRRELFRSDRLHPNAAGYQKWTAVIKPVLLADLGNEAG